MFTQEVNVDAMYRATTLLFGDQAAMILAKLADTIDRAQQDAYAVGVLDGHDNREAACDAAFDAGWEHGEAEGRGVSDANASLAFDEGYLQGVQDARVSPTYADLNVQDIINDRADEHFETLLEEYDADNVQDSGDEA
jgi:hypothetical protein